MSVNPIHVVAAIIVSDRRILVARRCDNGLWEFPGGKREPGETSVECLVREIKEELDVDIRVGRLADHFEVQQGERTLAFEFYLAGAESSFVRLSVHTEARWLRPHALSDLAMHEADRRVATLLDSRGVPELFS
jgi:8-oxo-dGTP diphosphatase